MAQEDLLIEQKIIGRMQAVAELLEIETGFITIQARPPTSDFDNVKRWAWDMSAHWDPDGKVVLWRSGGKVACDIHDDGCNFSTGLVRSFAHSVTRERLAYGRYEAVAERAYCETPPPATPDEVAWATGSSERKSKKTLLNDLLLLYAADIIHSAEPDDIPSADSVLAAMLSTARLGSLKQDIDTYREKVIREHADSD